MRSRFGAAAMWLVIAGIAAVLGASAPSPASAQGRPTRPKIDRPDGAVWTVIRKNCISCHGIDDYAFYAMDKAGWQNLIDTKHKTGTGAGAADVLTEPDRNLLYTWLVDKFGPLSTPFPRNYVAPEITEFLTDPEANRLLQSVLHRMPCDRPHQYGEEFRRPVARHPGTDEREGRCAYRRGTRRDGRVVGQGQGY